MSVGNAHPVQAEVLLPCRDLDETVEFFTGELGFRIDTIFPADDPAVAQLSGHGLNLRLERGADVEPGSLRILCREAEAKQLTAPNGTRIDLVPADPPLVLPPVRQSLVVTEMADEADWGVGRAGMRYRDLIPDRQGGRVIASHIRIPDGGPVPDYVHFHKIHFQMIYCYRGWVRVVYEDQGPPFVMQAGDCVLQPPEIRHRVLESSGGLDVIEIGVPAEHMTCVDHALSLPTAELRPARDFGGQRFVRHEAQSAAWLPWHLDGFEARDTGIGAATGGLAGVKVARLAGASPEKAPVYRHDGEFAFLFVLEGGMTLKAEAVRTLKAGDSVVLPAGPDYGISGCTDDVELLEVTLPALR